MTWQAMSGEPYREDGRGQCVAPRLALQEGDAGGRRGAPPAVGGVHGAQRAQRALALPQRRAQQVLRGAPEIRGRGRGVMGCV